MGRERIFAFARSEVVPKAIKGIFWVKDSLKPTKLETVDGTTLQSAIEAGAEGYFLDAAHRFHTVIEIERDSDIRAEAVIGLAQEYINLGKLGEARQLLVRDYYELTQGLPEEQQPYYQARRLSKIGWICDCEGDFRSSVEHFTIARELLKDKGLNEEVESAYSETTHFLGRAHLGLARQGKDRDQNLDRAGFFC